MNLRQSEDVVTEFAQKLKKVAVAIVATSEAIRVEAVLLPNFLFSTSLALGSYM